MSDTEIKKPRGIKIRNQSYVKHYNIQTVLRVLEECQPVSRTDMVRLTEMSPTSITRIINALINLGLIYETESVPKRSRGRKAINLCVKHDGVYSMGVFLTYDRIRTCLMDYGNNVIYSDVMPLEKRHYSPHELAALCREMYESTPKHLVRDWKCICAIGVSCAGIVEPSQGRVVKSDQMGWENVNLVDVFREEIGLPVWLENDVKSCLIGEKACRGLTDDVDTAYLMVGTGVGVAATVSGRVMRGFSCRSGEIERVPIVPGLPDETTLHQHLIEASLIESAAGFDPSIDNISGLIRNLDKPWAQNILADFKRYLSFIIQMVDGICDPYRIILGGTLIPQLAPYIRDVLPEERVIIGENYEDACVTGAAIVAMRGVITALINEQIEL
ncbi:MAG: ROK family protein [Candidatus Fimadaptatus sp.]|jgi:N-acetylglucosamine repressor